MGAKPCDSDIGQREEMMIMDNVVAKGIMEAAETCKLNEVMP